MSRPEGYAADYLRKLLPDFRCDWSGLRNRFEDAVSVLEAQTTYEMRSAHLDELARVFEDAFDRALLAERAAKWMTIDTAPTDGGMDQEYLMWDGRAVHVASVWWFEDEERKVPAWFTGEYQIQPTHWQPLPSPPAIRNPT